MLPPKPKAPAAPVAPKAPAAPGKAAPKAFNKQKQLSQAAALRKPRGAPMAPSPAAARVPPVAEE